MSSESDNNISECLREAVFFKMSSALRSLFATILVHCNPMYIRKLWDTFYEDMSEDFNKLYVNSHNTILQFTLNNINDFLQSMGKSIGIHHIPQPDDNFIEVGPSECREINEEIYVQIPTEDYDSQSQLNIEQHHAFTKIMQIIDVGTTGIFFVDGLGGTGKTYLYRALLANVISRGMIGLVTTTCGVAASILPGGRTTHSRFEIPLQTNESTMTNMSKQSGADKLIKKAKMIIRDEAPMDRRQTIEIVDRSFRDTMVIDEPFDGKVLIFGGYFRQVFLVSPKSTRAEIVNASLVKSYLWPLMEKIQFTRNMRARTNPTFSEFLLRAEESIIKEIFQNLQENAGMAKYVTERAILASINDHVDKLNDKLISQFPGESKIFNNFDSAEDGTNNYYQEEYLNTLTPNGLPPYRRGGEADTGGNQASPQAPASGVQVHVNLAALTDGEVRAALVQMDQAISAQAHAIII
ncbi:uncharacterized protein LOC107009752 [Solanum pennellii]|uniref:ATP-dependent DNA helicase n=1 Tax=Solanum pennellii TaxID=28526 RepID=A0ABM1G1G5_SOLPN|nr:uncharacterized protein LOC107009752 [Solanum pennellii]